MYAITGVIGKVGGATARALLAAGQSVRAVGDEVNSAPWDGQQISPTSTGTVCPSLCADGGQVVGARQVIDTRAQSLP